MKNRININSLSLYPFKYDKIIVGFSGGADSTALLLLLKKASQNCNNQVFKLEAVHFEHGIRGDASLKDAQWCKDFCAEYQIPLKVINLNLSKETSNLEAIARYKRIDYWIKNATGVKTAVALGHHQDDKAENFFLRLMRGGNSSSLTSLRIEKTIRGVTFIRPLLVFPKIEIENFLIKMGITNWCTDLSNADIKYKRNLIRHQIIPLFRKEFPSADRALNKSLFALQTDAEFVEQSALEKYSEIKDNNNIQIQWFINLHNALLVRILRYWISKQTEKEFIPTSDFICRFEYLIKKYITSKQPYELKKIIQLPGNYSLVFQNDSVFLSKNIETVVIKLDSMIWNWKINKQITFKNLKFTAEVISNITPKEVCGNNELTAYYNLEKCPDEFIIRMREKGDKMIPFSAHSPVSVKKLLENAKITGYDKKKVTILTTPEADTIIWLPGIKRSNFAIVDFSDTTQKNNILKVTASKLTS